MIQQELTQDILSEERLVAPRRIRDGAHTPIFWQRFWSHPGAYFGLAILLLFVLMAIFAPQITPGVDANTSFLFQLHGIYTASGPSMQDFPSRILGNVAFSDFDGTRRSVLAELTFGAQASLTVCFTATALATIIGVTLGACSGYFGGWLDAVVMRITDIILAVPFLPLVAFIVILAPIHLGSIPSIIALFTLFGWPEIARATRARFLLLRREGFTEAAQAQGVGSLRIIFRHLLPNAVPAIITVTSSTVVLFLLTEATLDFLSLGVTTHMTWGYAFVTAYDSVLTASWWAIIFPGLCIVLTVLGVNLVGEALRDAFDVRGSSL